ncbi:CU044_5270 family protein [Streptomyces sp. GC420]|uniref:CU044_5270 family protein n=1 Tax=Streptomyces sp. GC420 TaxID=2697568 RepID=UPI001415290B|nr:CU044_5270 family protein [Streptomyces sp. GC420]NBM15144.1 hypothetical protein [Streptomyces sp. GC420]
MNTTPRRSGPADWEESAPLLPVPVRPLPADRHQFHKENLMSRIHQDRAAGTHTGTARSTRFRLPRPAITLPAMACALAGAVVAGVTMTGGPADPGSGLATGPVLTTQIGTATSKGVPQLLDQIALASAGEDHPAVKPGQYVYVESMTADTHIRTDGDKSTVVSEKLHKRQVWHSPDGTKGWLIDPTVNDSPEGETLSLPDEQGNPFEASLNGPSYNYLTTLPTDPDVLLRKIYKETEGMGNGPDQQAFTTIGDLLGESYPPAELSSALFKTAAKIPGVVVVKDAVDAVGRHGVAVARLDETSGQREEWIFDKKTRVFLGKRVVQVNNVKGEDNLIKPGTVAFTSAVLKRAIVDDIKHDSSQAG